MTKQVTIRLSADEDLQGTKLEQETQRATRLVTQQVNMEVAALNGHVSSVYSPTFSFHVAGNGDTVIIVALSAVLLYSPSAEQAANDRRAQNIKVGRSPRRHRDAQVITTKEKAVRQIINNSSKTEGKLQQQIVDTISQKISGSVVNAGEIPSMRGVF